MESESIANFCAITDASDTTAEYFLSAAGGDLDMAIGLFYEHGGSTPAVSTFIGAASVENEEPSSSSSFVTPFAHSAAVNSEEEDAGAVILTTSTNRFSSSSDEDDFDREGGVTTTTISNTTTSTTRRLADLFRPPHAIMFNGPFESARKAARDQGRWLLLSVHNPTNFASQAMNRDLWNSALLQGFIRENFVFVQMVSGGVEESRYSNFYPYDDLHPHVALIDPRTGERVETLLVASIPVPGFRLIKSDREMLELLGEFIAEHSMEPIERKRSSSSPKLDKEESVESKRVLVSKLDDTTSKTLLTSSPKSLLTSSSPTSPTTTTLSTPIPSYDGPDGIFIQFRLPDGQRHRHRFPPTSKISQVFQVAAAASKSPLGSFKLRTAEGELKEGDFEDCCNDDDDDGGDREGIKSLHNTMLTISK